MKRDTQTENEGLIDFLRELLYAHKRPTCAWREDGTLLYANESFLHFFATDSLSEIQNHFSSAPNTTLESLPLHSYFARVLDDDIYQTSWTHTFSDTQKINVHYTLSHVHYNNENIIIGILNTPKPAQVDMAEQDDLLIQNALKIVEASPTAIGLWNKNHQIISCNSVFLKLFDVQSLEEHKEKLTKYFPEFQPCGTPSVKFASHALERAFAEGYADIEWLWHDRDGKALPTMTTLRRVTLDDTEYVIEYIYDLRNLQSIKEIAKEADERVQIMWDSMPLGAYFWNKQLQNIDCNMAAVRLFGLDSKQEFLDSFHKLSPEFQPNGRESSEYCKEILSKAFREGYAEFKWKHILPNGDSLPTHMTFIRTEYKGEDVVLSYVMDLREIQASVKQASRIQEHNQIMFNTAPLGITLWNEEYEMLECNDEVLRIYNFSDKSEYLNNILHITPEFQPSGIRSDELVWDHLHHAFEVGYHRFEWMHQDIEGNPIPMDVVLVRSMHEGKKVVISYTRDLRELKDAQEKAKLCEERFQTIYNDMPVGMNFWDKNYQLIDCNKSTLKLFDVNSTQEYLQSFYKFSPEFQPDGSISAKRIIEDFSLAFKEGFCQFDWTHQKLDGTQFPTKKTLVRSSQNGEDIIIVFTRDLSDVVASQALLRESELRLELMLDYLPIGIHFWDDNKKLIYCNMASVHLFGFESKEDYLRNFSSTIPKNQPEWAPSIEKLTAVLDESYDTDQVVVKFLGINPFTKEEIPAEATIKRATYQGKTGVISYIRDMRK